MSTRQVTIAIGAMCLALVYTGNLHAQGSGKKAVLRCGWFENPTPANAWLTDKDGTWTIGVQGGHQADGDWPDFSDARWVGTNRSYGYGCACLRVHAQEASHQVTQIVFAWSRPLAVCRRDARLKEPKG